MLFANNDPKVLRACSVLEPYEIFNFDVYSLAHGKIDIEEVDIFFDKLKIIFNEMHHSGDKKLYARVAKTFEEHIGIFFPDKENNWAERGYMVSATVFSFCHFVQQAQFKDGNKKPYMLHISIESCEFIYPLAPECEFRLTKEFFDEMKRTQHEATNQMVHIFTGAKMRKVV